MSDVMVILAVLAVNTAFLILCMHITGRMWGIDFGRLWPGVGKVVGFLLVTAIVSQYVGAGAFIINLIIYLVGFAIAFRLDRTELMLFTATYWVLSMALRMLLLLLLLG